MQEILSSLLKYSGSFKGNGINHDNEDFNGEFSLSPILDGKGCAIKFKASGKDGTIYHQEETTIAPTPNESLGLWTLNNNVPFLYLHDFVDSNPVEGAEGTLIFRHNNPEDSSQFREEIAIDLWPNGDLSYRYSWGMPNGDYKERSGLRMVKN